MSDGRLLVTFGALSQASSDISAGISTMNTKLSDLESAAAPLVGTWEGTAKEAYAERQRAWRSAAQELTTILGNIKKALDDSAQDYQTTESTNTKLFR